jgi:DNA-binding phage protein
MAKHMGKRIYREATVDEQERHRRIREQIQQELPDIEQRAKQHLADAMQRGIAIQQTMAVLKAERRKKGLSLSEMKERTGIERSTLSRLENQADANPTIQTLTRYAAAVGKKVLVVFVDAEDADS